MDHGVRRPSGCLQAIEVVHEGQLTPSVVLHSIVCVGGCADENERAECMGASLCAVLCCVASRRVVLCLLVCVRVLRRVVQFCVACIGIVCVCV